MKLVLFTNSIIIIVHNVEVQMAPNRKANLLFIMLMPLFLAGIVLDSVSEDIYKTISKDGTILYSDKAPLDNSPAEIVTLKNNNSVPAVRPIRKIQHLNEKKTLSAAVEIVTPEHQDVISMGPGDFKVVVSAVPALSFGEELELILDDKPLSGQRENVWNLKNIARGTHQLQVIRKYESGEISHKSSKIEILVLRPLPARN